jgi:hypothetical protein
MSMENDNPGCATCLHLEAELRLSVMESDRSREADCRVLMRRHPAHDNNPVKAESGADSVFEFGGDRSGPGKICGANAVLPPGLAAAMVEAAPEGAGTPFFERELRCLLEEHPGEERHFALAWQLDDAREGELWASWTDGRVPDRGSLLADCPAVDGRKGADEEACTLFAGHPGAHSFSLRDPDEERLRACPEYVRLRAEVDARMRDAGFSGEAA